MSYKQQWGIIYQRAGHFLEACEWSVAHTNSSSIVEFTFIWMSIIRDAEEIPVIRADHKRLNECRLRLLKIVRAASAAHRTPAVDSTAIQVGQTVAAGFNFTLKTAMTQRAVQYMQWQICWHTVPNVRVWRGVWSALQHCPALYCL